MPNLPKKAKVSPSPSESSSYLVSKYKPKKLSDIIGNASAIKTLSDYLLNFKTIKDIKKAALLAGAPGIGKTTIAHIVSASLGFDKIEFNASDVRNKSLIKSKVSSIVCNNSILSSLKRVSPSSTQTSQPSHRKPVLIMDEVDGMSAGDRGGVTELINIIKKTKIPIILICNDKSSLKLKTLLNYAIDLKIRRPSVPQLVPKILKIALAEGIKVDKPLIEKLVISSKNDIRSILNTLTLWKTHKPNLEESKKDTSIGTFEAAALIFKDFNSLNTSYQDSLAILKKAYFTDYSLIPLFVFENYLMLKGWRNNYDSLITVNKFLSYSDLVSNVIRKNQNYSFLNIHAMLSSVVPAQILSSMFGGSMLKFPNLLGKISSKNKSTRIIAENLNNNAVLNNNGLGKDLYRNYEGEYNDRIFVKLLKNEKLEKVVELIDLLSLTKEDLINFNIMIAKDMEEGDLYTKVGGKAKTKLTRMYQGSKSYKRFNENWAVQKGKKKGGKAGKEEKGKKEESDSEGESFYEDSEELVDMD